MSDIDTDRLAECMMANKFEEQLLRYENEDIEDIIICYNLATFSNGRSEAILQSDLKEKWTTVEGRNWHNALTTRKVIRKTRR